VHLVGYFRNYAQNICNDRQMLMQNLTAAAEGELSIIQECLKTSVPLLTVHIAGTPFLH